MNGRLTGIDKLLTDHQAIIDAWYAEWLAKVKAHTHAVWARRLALSDKDRADIHPLRWSARP
jgi:hypothetical protein